MFNWLKKLFGFELPDLSIRQPPHEGWHDDGKLPPVEDWECLDDKRVVPINRGRRPRIVGQHKEEIES